MIFTYRGNRPVGAISSQCNSYIWKATKAATAKMTDGMADRPRPVLHYDQFVETDLLFPWLLA